MRVSVLLSLQRALLGQIPPHMRAVSVTFDETTIRIAVFFDGMITEDDRENMSVAETEVIADFPESVA